MHKKCNFMLSVHIGARWVKPAERIFLTPKLLMGALPATPASGVTSTHEYASSNVYEISVHVSKIITEMYPLSPLLGSARNGTDSNINNYF